MEKTFEVFGDVGLYGNVYIFLCLIPFNFQSTVVITFKVHGNFVFFKIVQEIISIGIVKIFYTKIINAEIFFVCCMPPDACRVFVRDINEGKYFLLSCSILII